MSTAHTPTADVAIWTDLERVATTAAILREMGALIRPVVIGGSRSSEVSKLASDIGCPTTDDPRQLVIEHPTDYILLQAGTPISPNDLRDAVGRGTKVLAIEPTASDIDHLTQFDSEDPLVKPSRHIKPNKLIGTHSASTQGSGSFKDPTGRVAWVTAFESATGWAGAAEPETVVGQVRSMVYQSCGTSGECSLYARLFDGWRTILRIGATPDVIDASIVGHLGTATDDLRTMSGTLSAHARLPDNSSAVLSVSDQSGRWTRSLRIVGSGGQADVTDDGFYFVSNESIDLDESTPTNSRSTFVQVVANRWRKIMQDRALAATTAISPDDRTIVSCCMACALSARTGQPENPTKLKQLAGV